MPTKASINVSPIRPARHLKHGFLVFLLVLVIMPLLRLSMFYISPDEEPELHIDIIYAIFVWCFIFAIVFQTKIDRAAIAFEAELFKRLKKQMHPAYANAYTEIASRKVIVATHKKGYVGPRADELFERLLTEKGRMDDFVHYMFIKCYVRLDKVPVTSGRREMQLIEMLLREYVPVYLTVKMGVHVPMTDNDRDHADMGIFK
jgi:hypothetical protein